jgi:hypothetical protein
LAVTSIKYFANGTWHCERQEAAERFSSIITKVCDLAVAADRIESAVQASVLIEVILNHKTFSFGLLNKLTLDF